MGVSGGCRVSFWGDESVMELVVMVESMLNTTGWYTFKGNLWDMCISIKLFLKK